MRYTISNRTFCVSNTRSCISFVSVVCVWSPSWMTGWQAGRQADRHNRHKTHVKFRRFSTEHCQESILLLLRCMLAIIIDVIFGCNGIRWMSDRWQISICTVYTFISTDSWIEIGLGRNSMAIITCEYLNYSFIYWQLWTIRETSNQYLDAKKHPRAA